MKLDDWRKLKGFSYEELAKMLGLGNSKTYRICKGENICIRLIDATAVVNKTSGEVGFEDLLTGEDC